MTESQSSTAKHGPMGRWVASHVIETEHECFEFRGGTMELLLRAREQDHKLAVAITAINAIVHLLPSIGEWQEVKDALAGAQ